MPDAGVGCKRQIAVSEFAGDLMTPKAFLWPHRELREAQMRRLWTRFEVVQAAAGGSRPPFQSAISRTKTRFVDDCELRGTRSRSGHSRQGRISSLAVGKTAGFERRCHRRGRRSSRGTMCGSAVGRLRHLIRLAEDEGECKPGTRGVNAAICTLNGTNRKANYKQILVTKDRSRLRVICATPLQKRPVKPRSARFLYCVCRDVR